MTSTFGCFFLMSSDNSCARCISLSISGFTAPIVNFAASILGAMSKFSSAVPASDDLMTFSSASSRDLSSNLLRLVVPNLPSLISFIETALSNKVLKSVNSPFSIVISLVCVNATVYCALISPFLSIRLFNLSETSIIFAIIIYPLL